MTSSRVEQAQGTKKQSEALLWPTGHARRDREANQKLVAMLVKRE
jgi:hypothetical protein